MRNLATMDHTFSMVKFTQYFDFGDPLKDTHKSSSHLTWERSIGTSLSQGSNSIVESVNASFLNCENHFILANLLSLVKCVHCVPSTSIWQKISNS